MLLAGVLGACVSCGSNNTQAGAGMPMPGEAGTPKVTVQTATSRDVPQTEVYTSTVQAYAVNNVVPQTGSRIKKINVEIGDFVRKGQVLAEMEQVSLTQSRLKLANDSTELSRLKQLYNEGGISKSDYEAVELAYKVSKSTYENLLENTILRSPLNGVITARNYDAGDMYAMASPIYVVQQITPVKLLVGISESDYTKVKKGDVVSITVDALPGQTFQGKVNRIYPVMDAMSHTFTAEVVVNNSDRALRPGMYAKVTVTFAVNHSIVIPDEALVKQQGSAVRSVYILDRATNTVRNSVVKVGRFLGTECEILEGISEGDEIVVKGHIALKNGSEVEVI